jgi:glycerophosphoryl diester phosphodiesterase
MTRDDRVLALPIGFAHRGAKAAAPENTLEAFRLALEMGATGLESDAWVTADGEVVLDHDGVVGGWPRRRPIATVARRRLPGHIPTLAELYEDVGTDYELSVDIKDPEALDGVVAAARAVDADDRLWLCHPDGEQLVSWRDRVGRARLVHSTHLRRMRQGPERRAAAMAEEGIDAVNLHHSEWTGGLTTLFHRFGRVCFGWDAQQPRHLAELLNAGVDGLFSDHVDRMVEALAVEAAR